MTYSNEYTHKMEKIYTIPTLPLPYDLETKEILRQVNKANRNLAELKGVAQTIPNERILISSLTLQEAKDSSAVENIVTTQDDLYRAGIVSLGLLEKKRIGKENYYINTRLMNLFIEYGKYDSDNNPITIESTHVNKTAIS